MSLQSLLKSPFRKKEYQEKQQAEQGLGGQAQTNHQPHHGRQAQTPKPSTTIFLPHGRAVVSLIARQPKELEHLQQEKEAHQRIKRIRLQIVVRIEQDMHHQRNKQQEAHQNNLDYRERQYFLFK